MRSISLNYLLLLQVHWVEVTPCRCVCVSDYRGAHRGRRLFENVEIEIETIKI
jgi:N-acetylglutamate synthase-like GNAT family acetyltransferase